MKLRFKVTTFNQTLKARPPIPGVPATATTPAVPPKPQPPVKLTTMQLNLLVPTGPDDVNAGAFAAGMGTSGAITIQNVLAEALQGLGLEDNCVVTIELEPSTADGTGSN